MEMLTDKKGAVLPLMAGIVLAFMMLFLCVMQFGRAMVIATGCRDALRNAVIDATNDNFINAYSSLRDSYTSAYYLDDNGVYTDTSGEHVAASITKVLGLTSVDGNYVSKQGGQTEYTLSDLTVTIHNPEAGQSGTYSVDATATLSIKMPLALPNVTVPLSVSAAFETKF